MPLIIQSKRSPHSGIQYINVFMYELTYIAFSSKYDPKNTNYLIL